MQVHTLYQVGTRLWACHLQTVWALLHGDACTGAGPGGAGAGAGVQVRLSSLVGAGKEALAQSFRDVQLGTVSAAELWRLAGTGKFREAAGEPAALWLRGATPRLLPGDAPLAAAGVPGNTTVELAAALPRVLPLPSRVASAVPDGSSASVSLRPPGAFTVRRPLGPCCSHA